MLWILVVDFNVWNFLAKTPTEPFSPFRFRSFSGDDFFSRPFVRGRKWESPSSRKRRRQRRDAQRRACARDVRKGVIDPLQLRFSCHVFFSFSWWCFMFWLIQKASGFSISGCSYTFRFRLVSGAFHGTVPVKSSGACRLLPAKSCCLTSLRGTTVKQFFFPGKDHKKPTKNHKKTWVLEFQTTLLTFNPGSV